MRKTLTTLATLVAATFMLGANAQTTQPQATTHEGASTSAKSQAAGEAKKDARMDKPGAKASGGSTAQGDSGAGMVSRGDVGSGKTTDTKK